MDNMIQEAFGNHINFQKARDLTFVKFLAKFEKTPHFLAFYADNEFKKEFKQATDAQINKKLSQIIELFCCLQGRDVFIAKYSDLLAQRLLNKTSVSQMAEEKMISKLAVECGHNIVNKIKQMFEDVNNSQQFMRDYKNSTKDYASTAQFEFDAEILTSSSWPSYDEGSCTLPK